MKSPARWTYWLAAGVWTIVTVPAGFVAGRAATTDTSASFEQPAPAAIAERAFPGARINYVGSGTFQVPAQATPGTYIVAAGSSTFCTWARL